MTNQPTTNQGTFNSADYSTERITRILTASVIGDADLCTHKSNKNAFYRTAKLTGHDDYLFWLRSVVGLIAPTKTCMAYKGVYPGTIYAILEAQRIESKTHPLFTELHTLIYRDRVKTAPEAIELDLESIAILLMDNGVGHPRLGYIKINTNCSDLTSVKILQAQFVGVTKLPWTVKKRPGKSKTGGIRYALRLPRRYVAKLTSMLKPFVFPSFYYKLASTGENND